jgi:hypothetical protein
MKTFSQFITEANRKAQKASKAGRKPKEGERSTKPAMKRSGAIR